MGQATLDLPDPLNEPSRTAPSSARTISFRNSRPNRSINFFPIRKQLRRIWLPRRRMRRRT